MDPLFYFDVFLLRMIQSKKVAVCACVCMWKINNVHLLYFISILCNFMLTLASFRRQLQYFVFILQLQYLIILQIKT